MSLHLPSYLNEYGHWLKGQDPLTRGVHRTHHIRTFVWLKWGPICTMPRKKERTIHAQSWALWTFIKIHSSEQLISSKQRKYYLTHQQTMKVSLLSMKNRASTGSLWVLGTRGMMILLHHSPCRSCIKLKKKQQTNMIVSYCDIVE